MLPGKRQAAQCGRCVDVAGVGPAETGADRDPAKPSTQCIGQVERGVVRCGARARSARPAQWKATNQLMNATCVRSIVCGEGWLYAIT